MTPDALLDDLDAAGVRLFLAGDRLRYQTRPGVSIEPHRERIAANRPALMAALALQERIVVAATAEPGQFNRAAYDTLWEEWRAMNEGNTG